jgi:hypothetical protein
MTPALEQLAELVRQAEAKTRARKIEGETQQAAEQFRASELRARQAVERLRTVRPASLRALEQADSDEHLLKDLVRKLAQFKSSLESQTDAEQLIASSQTEIERTRKQARIDLEEVMREVEEARRELRAAVDQYRQLRREIDRLQPELASQFAAEDRLLWDAEGHFPGGQLQLLAHEVENGLGAFGALSKLEQYSRLKVWIGRFRYYQSLHERDSETTEELQNLGHRVFHQLKWLSRHYEPGYIEAFRQDFSTDWAAYVAEAQEQLAQAMETGRRARDGESSRVRGRDGNVAPRGAQSVSAPQAPGVRGSRPSPLLQLKIFLSRARLPEEGLERFHEMLRQIIDEIGPEDTELIRLTLPYRQLISGNDQLGVLRNNLEQIFTNGRLLEGEDDELFDEQDDGEPDENEDEED